MAQPEERQTLARPAFVKASAGRPPIVAVLGHVDHGKTTLLDTIRKTNIAAREHGGITQHIGAYQIELRTKNKELRTITFIDTPGHEAFAKMRSRGAQVADIAILVVAADDSVKPQTLESIQQIKAAGIPLIVAINKIDLPAANVDKVKTDLAKNGVQVEGFGGDVPLALVSAKQGRGVPELLDLILLVAEMRGLSGEPQAPLEAVVIETKLDKFRGMVATLIIKKGTLSVATPLYQGSTLVGKVRACFDENRKVVSDAGPSRPVEVLGFSSLPEVGALLSGQPGEVTGAPQAKPPAKKEAADFLAEMTAAEKKKLKLVLKADTAGSLEAIIGSLPEAKVEIVKKDLGDITEADVLDARATGAFIVGFNVKAGPAIEKLARAEKVVVRTYTLIYKLLEELADVARGLEEVLALERELGRGQIIAEFPYEDNRIAGTRVTSGRLAKGDSVKIMRGEVEVSRVRIKSMRQGRQDTTKTEAGGECGILFDKKVDFALSDAIIAVTTG